MEAKTLTRCREQKMADKPYLPDEVIFENIITRVPVSTLMRCCCVSKHWYKSILDDSHFEISYLAHQSSKKDPHFVFYNLNAPRHDDDKSSSKFPNRNYIFGLVKDDDYERKKRKRSKDIGVHDLFFREKFVIRSKCYTRIQLVGNCNGLVCLSQIELVDNCIMIVNPSRDEVLTIFYPPIIKNSHVRLRYYGFGFNSLTHEYKVVLIVVKNSEFKCLVFTLGTNSWRETSTTIPLSPVTTTSFYRSAIVCGGALFWKTKSSSDNNMLLLSFDLHDEEFQVIRLPAECASSSSLLEQQYQINYPLLEFKGSPCVARLEKTFLGGGGGMCSSTSSDDQSTSYCYKVHLHILKEYNKVGRPNEQVWIKETFDVPPISYTPAADFSPTAPCFFMKDTTTYRAPPNRIMSSSDGRVFLYSFRAGQVIETYDLQTKRTYVANYGRYAGTLNQKNHSNVYGQIDYHLNGSHIENFMSMLTFIPKGGGAPSRLDRDELISILNDKQRTFPVVGHLGVRPLKSTGHFHLLI